MKSEVAMRRDRLCSGSYFLTSLTVFSVVATVVAFQVGKFGDEAWLYCLLHFGLAALLNAALLKTVERKSLAFLGSPLLSLLVVSQIYFTLSAVKYFVPNPAYPQFGLTTQERFMGSMIGGLTLGGGIVLLRVWGALGRDELVNWVMHDRVLPYIVLVLALVSSLLSVALFRLGYGAPYTEAQGIYTIYYNVRRYSDLFLIYANVLFGGIAIALGPAYLAKLKVQNRRLTAGHIAAWLSITSMVGWGLYMRHRSVFLNLLLMAFSGLQVLSHRRALQAFRLLLVALPVILTFWLSTLMAFIGRAMPWQMSSALEVNLGDIGYRSDLTDYAMGLLKASEGRIAGIPLLADAFVNAVPRFLWSGKDAFWQDAYASFVMGLGWPQVDYTDTLFSAGVMLVGEWGFFIVPLAYMILLGVLAKLIQRWINGYWKYYILLTLGLGGLEIETEWTLLFTRWRDRMFFGLMLLALVFLFRLSRSAVWRRSRQRSETIPNSSVLFSSSRAEIGKSQPILEKGE